MTPQPQAPSPAHARVGRRTVHHEFRVTGDGPYGEFDHGWRRWRREKARKHARKMASHETVGEVRLEHRIVETEVLDVETFVDDRDEPPTTAAQSDAEHR